MILERVTPESVGIHSEGILKFIDLAESRGLELQQHDAAAPRQGAQRLVEAVGNSASPHMMFSFTKALTLHGHRLACQRERCL
ncbi:hypothetical protein [Hominenteromicrobium sp.]|uniref:hypothetical protein n=1 Tax=Hominenteromicrobium sp. TaxID=3073581 RepID=UPI00399AEDDD